MIGSTSSGVIQGLVQGTWHSRRPCPQRRSSANVSSSTTAGSRYREVGVKRSASLDDTGPHQEVIAGLHSDLAQLGRVRELHVSLIEKRQDVRLVRNAELLNRLGQEHVDGFIHVDRERLLDAVVTHEDIEGVGGFAFPFLVGAWRRKYFSHLSTPAWGLARTFAQ